MKTIFRNFAVVVSLGLSAFVASAGSGLAAESREFTHPSVLSTQEDLASLKKRVTSNPSAKLGYEQLRNSKYADLSRPHTPYETVYVIASGVNKYERAFRGDAQAARATALMWVITGDTRYRDKSIGILDDWAATFKDMVVEKGGKTQSRLECAWAVPIWTAAADIIRYYNKGATGWSPEQIAQFDKFLSPLVELAEATCLRANNWGTSATLAMIAVAVYQEDVAFYDKAINNYRELFAGVSNKDGSIEFDYLRDSTHPQYTVLTWIQSCEIAWNQGDDLYGIKLDGQSLPRLAVCLEHFSKLFLGELPNPEGLRKGNYRNAHLRRQGYDMAYNHFIIRRNMAASMPAFAELVPAWRPGGFDDHFLAWDTLTHGELSSEKWVE